MDARWIVGIVVALLVLWAGVLLLLWLTRPRGLATRDLLRVLPDVLRLGRSIVADRSVPLDVRLALIGALVWIVSPIDLIPEFIPVIGPLDDVVVAILVLRYAGRRLGIEELRRRWSGSDDGFRMVSRLLGSGG
jgi:uncharacterized membrane protein YkvA (DUF1232 family)